MNWDRVITLRQSAPADAAWMAEAASNISAPRLSQSAHDNPWWVILSVGGLCWLAITGTAIVWMWPYSGSLWQGSYVISVPARAFQHLLLFMVAAPAYRLTLACGWPDALRGRLLAVVVNLLLAILVMALSPISIAAAAAFIDHRTADAYQTFEAMKSWTLLEFWMAPLRFVFPSYFLGACAVALVWVNRQHHRDRLLASELQRAYSAARLATLSAQLQPHFLFNALNAVSALVYRNPEAAESMLMRLGEFLRYVLENSHWPWVELQKELQGLEAYLEVQRIRFSDRLTVCVETSEEARRCIIPVLLLQPLTENAIEHGRRGGEGAPLAVCVSAGVIADRLRIVVNNSTPRLYETLSVEEYGHGLSNVALRLQAAYGSAASLRVGPDAAGGTSATLDLPLRLESRPGAEGIRSA